jgi:hypothetical protein
MPIHATPITPVTPITTPPDSLLLVRYALVHRFIQGFLFHLFTIHDQCKPQLFILIGWLSTEEEAKLKIQYQVISLITMKN